METQVVLRQGAASSALFPELDSTCAPDLDAGSDRASVGACPFKIQDDSVAGRDALLRQRRRGFVLAFDQGLGPPVVVDVGDRSPRTARCSQMPGPDAREISANRFPARFW